MRRVETTNYSLCALISLGAVFFSQAVRIYLCKEDWLAR